MIARSFLALPLLLPALVGCGNAAIDDKITALQDDNLRPSAFHRAGQPCILCHGVYKGASPELVIGGSVFAGIPDNPKAKPIPVPGAKIIITDALNNVNGAKSPDTHDITTNCAGNFGLTHDEVVTRLGFDTIAFPLKVSVVCPKGGRTLEMKGRIAREGPCGGCHVGQKSENSPGLIVCDGSGAEVPTPQSCPGLFQQ